MSAATAPDSPGAAPPRDCPRCPRLVAFRGKHRASQPDWHNAPVPSFGPASARLLIVGLAPGLKGANRTGRPFTGDYAGDLLYPTLVKFGFAAGSYGARPDDGLSLVDCRITNSVRCVPPENKPELTEIVAHGALHRLGGGLLLADSYHCSRYNTNTGKLTVAMFESVFVEIRQRLALPG